MPPTLQPGASPVVAGVRDRPAWCWQWCWWSCRLPFAGNGHLAQSAATVRQRGYLALHWSVGVGDFAPRPLGNRSNRAWTACWSAWDILTFTTLRAP